ncbi:MAG TPA: MoxR family ATPase [Chthonomonadales bacterium]|nr:MoxR family ATPase [Chthonomonadales bacterium]
MGRTEMDQRQEDIVELSAMAGLLQRNLESVIRGKSDSIRLVVISLLAGGHTLLEDVPGTGKTTLAKSLARSIDGIFRRVQFTPDLLPADITGSSFYNPGTGAFEFREGPVFANILLVDEINRTSPRTQSALLEVMSENQITVDGRRQDMPQPFFVIATQNSTDFHGTYPLPEAQLDRFTIRVTLGYPEAAYEIEVLYGQSLQHPFETLQPVLSCFNVLSLQEQVRSTQVDRSVAEYILRLVARLRAEPRLRLSVSPRGSLALYRTAQARARVEGRDYVLPEDVQALAISVLAHRVMLDTKARYGGALADEIVQQALDSVPVPR